MKKNREPNADFRFSLLVIIIGLVCAGLSLTVFAKTDVDQLRSGSNRSVTTHTVKHR